MSDWLLLRGTDCGKTSAPLVFMTTRTAEYDDYWHYGAGRSRFWRQWWDKHQRESGKGPSVPDDLHLTKEDLEYLKTFDTVKELLDGTGIM